MRTLLLALLVVALPAFADERNTYSRGAFDRIILDGAVELRLSQGERDQVTVGPDADAQQAVEVRVSGNRLVINDSGSWRFWNKSRPKVDVQVRSLRELIISGASDVYCTGPFKSEGLTVHISGSGLVRFDALNAEALRFVISGSGDGQLAGEVADMRLTVSGKGRFQADQLRAARAAVQISGVGNAQLWVTESLKLGVSGVGTIDYWGNPQVSRSSSGLASINARGDKR
jgi:hypothetical protein